MAGFLDSEERVIDMVLTETGKSLLLKGELQFKYWIPFDDEVDYDPPAGDVHQNQTSDQRRQELTESPLVREACSGYRELSLTQEDTTNVNRPMFTAPPGVGVNFPVPRMRLSTGSLDVTMSQKKIYKLYTQKAADGSTVVQQIGPVDAGVQRYDATEAQLGADYPAGSLPADHLPEGFLITMYHSSSMKQDELGQDIGGFEEILHNRESSGSIAYRNDLKLHVYTP